MNSSKRDPPNTFWGDPFRDSAYSSMTPSASSSSTNLAALASTHAVDLSRYIKLVEPQLQNAITNSTGGSKRKCKLCPRHARPEFGKGQEHLEPQHLAWKHYLRCKDPQCHDHKWRHTENAVGSPFDMERHLLLKHRLPTKPSSEDWKTFLRPTLGAGQQQGKAQRVRNRIWHQLNRSFPTGRSERTNAPTATRQAPRADGNLPGRPSTMRPFIVGQQGTPVPVLPFFQRRLNR